MRCSSQPVPRAPPPPLAMRFPSFDVAGFLFGKVANTNRFDTMCDETFADVDHDDDGALAVAELRLAVMLFYDRLNARMPLGRRARPPSRAQLEELFRESDHDDDARLSEEEFRGLMRAMCANVSAGVAFELAKALLVVPAVGKLLMGALRRCAPGARKRLDEAGGFGSAAVSAASAAIVSKLPLARPKWAC